MPLPIGTPEKLSISEKREALFGTEYRRAAPLSVVQAWSREVDRILSAIFNSILKQNRACLIALGGYGRMELCPYSDIDILILHEEGQDLELVSAAVRSFWDTGLQMGCVVRTLDQCASILGQDPATDTALLESRYLTGNREIYLRLQRGCIAPYFRKIKNAYIDGICQALKGGLFSSENTLFRAEPDLKNGICTLRDCQRLLWAERVRRGLTGFSAPNDPPRFPSTLTRRFEANYAFLTGLRIELHLMCNRRMDILEIDLQPIIAVLYGYGPNGAGYLMELFFKTVREIRLYLLSFLEKDLSGKNVWSVLRKRISANPIAPGLSVLDGIVFSDKKIEIGEKAAWMMNLFRSLLVHKATLSVELRNRLRRLAADPSIHDFADPEISRKFREILSWEEPVGTVLQMMHETGVLGKLIPPFHALNCKVEYDSYHEFTTDQHILLAVSCGDALADDPDEKIRSIRRSVKNPLLLRAALLLHDIGKAQSGDHVENGTIIAEQICYHLGFNRSETERLKFLVYHHLDLSNLSLSREPDDPTLKLFAEELGDQENLDLLYLLTIADIRSVGRNTWTNWKAFQLERLYDRIRALIEDPGLVRQAVIEDGLPISERSYFLDTLPEDRARHRQWLADFARTKQRTSLFLYHDRFTGFERITICGLDRPGFLSDLIGCISSEGYNILNARIYSTEDGRVLDIFYLEPAEIPAISPEEKMRNIERKWEMLQRRETTPDELVSERIRKYPPPPLRYRSRPPLQIRVNNLDSSLMTIVEIDAADNFGLLHKIARCLNENGINIVSARLSTRADQAFDVFYVCDLNKKKITDSAKLENLKGDLRLVLSE